MSDEIKCDCCGETILDVWRSRQKTPFHFCDDDCCCDFIRSVFAQIKLDNGFRELFMEHLDKLFSK